MSDVGFNVWGVITGVIGTIALLPVLLAWLNTYLPTARLPALLELLEKTEKTFKEGIDDGLLNDENEIYRFQTNIWTSMFRVDEVRSQVYDAQSWFEDYMNWRAGLSSRILLLQRELGSIASKLALRHSQERKRLAAAGYLVTLASKNAAKATERSVHCTHNAGSPYPEKTPLFTAGEGRVAPGSPLISSPTAPMPGARVTGGTPSDSGTCVSAADGMSTTSPYARYDASVSDTTSNTGEGTHRLVPEADLADLSLLAFPPLSQESVGDRAPSTVRAKRREVLKRFSRRLFGEDEDLDALDLTDVEDKRLSAHCPSNKRLPNPTAYRAAARSGCVGPRSLVVFPSAASDDDSGSEDWDSQ